MLNYQRVFSHYNHAISCINHHESTWFWFRLPGPRHDAPALGPHDEDHLREFRCRPRRESPLNKAKEVIAAIVDSNVFWTYKFGPAKTLWKNIFRCTKKIGIIKVYHLISFGFCIDIFCHVKKWTCHAQPKIDFDDSRWFQAIHGLDCCLPYNVSVDLSWQSYLVYLTFTGTHTHIYI